LSPSPSKERGRIVVEGALPLQTFLFAFDIRRAYLIKGV